MCQLKGTESEHVEKDKSCWHAIFMRNLEALIYIELFFFGETQMRPLQIKIY